MIYIVLISIYLHTLSIMIAPAPSMTLTSSRKAWATLLTKPDYLPGTVMLAASLRAVGSKYPLIAMVVNLPAEAHEVLQGFAIECVEVPRVDPKIQASAVQDKRFADTWTKLR